MARVTEVTPAVCRNLRPELESAARSFAESYGMTAQVGNAKYTPGSVTFQVTLSVVTEDGTVKSPEREAYETYAEMFYKLPKDGLDKTFADYSGRRFKVVGLNTKRGKYPVMVEDLQGKRYKMEAEKVRDLLAREARNGGGK